MSKHGIPDRDKDLISCPGESYTIERSICEARRKRGYKHCRRCPENTDQPSLFESPRQVSSLLPRKKKRKGFK